MLMYIILKIKKSNYIRAIMKRLFSSQLKNTFIINDIKVNCIIEILHSLIPIKSVCGKRPAQAKILF